MQLLFTLALPIFLYERRCANGQFRLQLADFHHSFQQPDTYFSASDNRSSEIHSGIDFVLIFLVKSLTNES